jgi:hypothetical protein
MILPRRSTRITGLHRIETYNQTAKPFKRTYTSKVLEA